MFEMTVIDAIKINDRLASVAGPYINKKQFTNRLVDNEGNVYEAHIPPFTKTLEFNDSEIILGLYGNYDAQALIGKVLRAEPTN